MASLLLKFRLLRVRLKFKRIRRRLLNQLSRRSAVTVSYPFGR